VASAGLRGRDDDLGLTFEFGFPVLSTLVFLPALGALVCLLVPRERPSALRTVPLVFAIATGLLALLISLGFEPRAVGAEMHVAYQFTERVPWVGPLGIEYFVGLDGISILMVLLTALLGVVAVLASWTSIERRLKEYMVCLLLLETAMLGVFVALDLVLFYVFWEAMLIPMVLIIGAWGGPRRVYAAVKFFIFTMLGSVLMLVGILWLHRLAGTFSIPELATRAPVAAAAHGELLFLLFGVAFAIKVPIVPLHTWLPDAHTEAPTAGSILLAGILLKMGAYGFLRMCVPFFPAATVAFAPAMVWLGVIGIIYGGACALAQRDVKRLVAYSSVSHLGFVILGTFVFNLQGLQGAILQMVNHGLSTGALFLLVGVMYERRHTRDISEYGGMWDAMPLLARLFLVVALSSIGLPGLNGFVGEWLVLTGALRAGHSAGNYGPAIVATLGVVLAAAYMLVMYRRVFFGEVTNPRNRGLTDMVRREVVAAGLLLVGIVGLGVYPRAALGFSERTAVNWLDAHAQALENIDVGRDFGTPQPPPGARVGPMSGLPGGGR